MIGQIATSPVARSKPLEMSHLIVFFVFFLQLFFRELLVRLQLSMKKKKPATSRGQHMSLVLFRFGLFFLFFFSPIVQWQKESITRIKEAAERHQSFLRTAPLPAGREERRREERKVGSYTHHADFEGIEKVKGQGGHQVDDEPGGQVVDADLAGVEDHLT